MRALLAWLSPTDAPGGKWFRRLAVGFVLAVLVMGLASWAMGWGG